MPNKHPSFAKNNEDKDAVGGVKDSAIERAFREAYPGAVISAVPVQRQDIEPAGRFYRVRADDRTFDVIETTQRTWPCPRKGQTEQEARSTLSRKQVERLVSGLVPVRWNGAKVQAPGVRAEDVPVSANGQVMRDFMDPRWDYYCAVWRAPTERELAGYRLIDLRVFRKLAEEHGLNAVLPPQTASFNPDGTVKRYLSPSRIKARFGVRIMAASYAERPTAGLLANLPAADRVL